MVYRLGSKEQLERRAQHDAPEILTSDISPLMLEAKLWGADEQLQLLDPPSAAQQTCELLQMLELIADGKLTAKAREIHAMGSDLRFAHLLYQAQQRESQHPGFVHLAVYFVALMEARVRIDAELATAISAQLHRPHPAFTQQLKYWRQRLSLPANKDLPMHLLPVVVALAYPDRLAKRRGSGMLLSNGAGVSAHPQLWLDEQYVAIADVGGKDGQHIFSATAFSPAMLQTHLPHLFSERQVCEFDIKSGRFINEQRQQLGAIVIATKPSGKKIDAQMKVQAWLELIQQRGWELFQHPQSQQLRVRMLLASQLLGGEFTLAGAPLLRQEAMAAPFLEHVGSYRNYSSLTIGVLCSAC